MRGDYRGGRGEPHQRIDRPVRGKPEEWVLDRCRIGEKQRALPEIIQEQSRKHKAQPAPSNGRWPEMSHIGIKGLSPGHRQNDRPEEHKGLPRIGHDQSDRVTRIEGFEDGRISRDFE